jgi:hypothetical protein
MNNNNVTWLESTPEQKEKIGRCDLCGLFDHHLIGGECPTCRGGTSFEVMSDARLELLGQRFQANHIFALQGLTFEEYLESPAQYDRIAKHMENGGGCRVVDGAMVANYG